MSRASNPLRRVAARLLPGWGSESLTRYIEAGSREALQTGMSRIEAGESHPLRNVRVSMVVGTCSFVFAGLLQIYSNSIENKYNFKQYNPYEIQKYLNAKTAVQYSNKNNAELASSIFISGSGASILFSLSEIGGCLSVLTLARRKRRGENAARDLFDGVITNDGKINGTKLLDAMQEFWATQKYFKDLGFDSKFDKDNWSDSKGYKGIWDPAVSSYIVSGEAYIDAILSEFRMEKGGILKETLAKLNYYNKLSEGSAQDDYFPTLTEQFDDPEFIRALALGIFNGGFHLVEALKQQDNGGFHQDLVEALKQYGDESALQDVMRDLCTKATIVVDVINKLQETIPDALPWELKYNKDKIARGRHKFIEMYPEIADCFQLCNLSSNSSIDEVNAAFAGLNYSGVLDLPSGGRELDPDAAFEARIAASEAGAPAAQAALNPAEQALKLRLDQLEREVQEDR